MKLVTIVKMCLAVLGLSTMMLLTPGCDKNDMKSASGAEVADDWAPEDLAPTPRTLLALARILQSQGKDPQAQFVLEKILREDPMFIPAYVELAELHMRNDRVTAAREIIQEGLQRHPNDGVLLNDMGMTFAVKEQYSEAQKYFEQTVSACPQNKKFRMNLAMALGMQGHYEKAYEMYCRALGPDEAHYNLGVLAEARRDRERAAKEFFLANLNANAAPGCDRPAGTAKTGVSTRPSDANGR